MFGTVLTVLFTFLLIYVLWRVSSVPFLKKSISRKVLIGIGLALWAVFFIARSAGHGGVGPAAALEPIGMALLGTVFITASVLFLVDLVTLFGLLFKRKLPSLRGGGLAAGILLSLFALVQGYRAPAIVPYEVTLPGLPKELNGSVLVAVSDAHLGAGRGNDWFSKRVEQIQALKPDLVVFLGDMFEGHGDAPQALPSLRELSAPLGKWFVLGNHESHRAAGTGTDVLEQAGFVHLQNRWVEPVPGLILVGVHYLTHHGLQDPKRDLLGLALAKRPTGAAILLSHYPTQAAHAAKDGVGLMLSGHTHGGQIWPFGYLVQREYPLLAGRYEVEGMTVLVSRGAGTWGPRMRLWRRGEILKVTLRAENPVGKRDR